MTTAAAAAELGVTTQTVRRYVAAGQLTLVARQRRQGKPALLVDAAEVRRLAKLRHPSARQAIAAANAARRNAPPVQT